MVRVAPFLTHGVECW